MKKQFLFLIGCLLALAPAVYGQDDIGVISIASPQSGCQIGNEQIQVDIFNFGDDLNLTSFPVRYTIDGGAPTSQTQAYASFNNNETNTVTFTFQGNFSGPGDHILKVYTDLGSDNDRTNDTLTVTITNFPPTQAGTLMADTTVCAGTTDTLFLEGNVGDVIGYQYSEDGGANWLNLANTDTFIVYVDLQTTRLYRAEVQSGDCPSEISNTVTVTVVDAPDAGFVFEDKSICGGVNEDTLYLRQYTGDIVIWQDSVNGSWNDVAGSGGSDTLIVNNITQTTAYRAIVTNNFCPNDTSEIATLTVINGTIGGDLEENDTVCLEGNMGTLTLNGHLGDITWWERSTDNGVSWSPQVNQTTTQNYVNLTETTLYRVLVEATNCASEYSDTVQILVYQPEVTINASGPLDFCIGDSVNLTAVPDSFDVYNWSTGENTVSITVFDQGMVYLDVVDSNGCTAEDSIQVIVYELPDIDAGEDQTISLGESAQLLATGGVLYEWSPAALLDDAFIEDPIAMPEETTIFTVIGTDENGCVNNDSMTVEVVVDYKFEANNTITPNGDGVNDTWIVDNITAYPEARVVILNRYGSVVFDRTDYQNDWSTKSEGQNLPDGTYYYIITVPNTDVLFKGHINVFSN